MTRTPPSAAPDWTLLHGQLSQTLGLPSRDPLPLGNRADPDEELVFLLLTHMTRSQRAIEDAHTAVHELAGSPPWEVLQDIDPDTLQQLLQPVGLVQRRSRALRSLGRIITSLHQGTLRTLAPLDDDHLLSALQALPGVGLKTARCLAAYCFDREMLAVDVHVIRVLKRLGYTEPDATWTAIDRQVNDQVPAGLRYDLHVLLVRHGRETCTCVSPRCEACPLERTCPSAHQASEARADYIIELRRGRSLH